MAYLTPNELNTHVYGEISDEINRGDDTLLQTAIDAAVDEAKGYLSNYDVASIFATTGDDRNKILLLFIKDIAIWHYIQLCNVSIDMQLRMDRYEKAVKWLDKVQSGKVVPNLPLPTVTEPDQLENFVKWGGNIKRQTYFN